MRPDAFGKMKPGMILRFNLCEADLEIVDAPKDWAQGKNVKRLYLTAPHPDTGTMMRWSFGMSVVAKLRECQNRGRDLVAIKRDGEGIQTRYAVHPIVTEEQRTIRELMDLAWEYEEEDAPL